MKKSLQSRTKHLLHILYDLVNKLTLAAHNNFKTLNFSYMDPFMSNLPMSTNQSIWPTPRHILEGLISNEFAKMKALWFQAFESHPDK